MKAVQSPMVPADDPVVRLLGLSSSSLLKAAPWIGVLIVLLIAFWLVWKWARRYSLDDQDRSGGAAAWTLEQLRDLRRRGQLTESEYESLRRQMLGAGRGGNGGSNSPSG